MINEIDFDSRERQNINTSHEKLKSSEISGYTKETENDEKVRTRGMKLKNE